MYSTLNIERTIQECRKNRTCLFYSVWTCSRYPQHRGSKEACLSTSTRHTGQNNKHVAISQVHACAYQLGVSDNHNLLLIITMDTIYGPC